MNLLHLVPKAVYDTKMSRVRFEEVASLPKANPPVVVHTTGPGWEDWSAAMNPVTYVDAWNANARGDKERMLHAVLSYGVNDCRPLTQDDHGMGPVPVFTIFHETYNYPQTLQRIRDVGASHVIFTYANDLALYQPAMEYLGVSLGSIPHSATEALYWQPLDADGHPIDQKDVDVLIVGNLAEQFYPFRYRLARLAKRELAKRGYKVVHLPHPGFTLPQAAEYVPVREGTYVGEGYATWLRRSKLVFTCCSKQKYAFAKLVEIALCGALPVSDLPAERRGFFRQTVLNVEPWMLDQEILAKVEDVLDDDDLRRRLTQVAHDKVAARLEMRHWAERFVYVMRRALGEAPDPPTPPIGEEDKE